VMGLSCKTFLSFYALLVLILYVIYVISIIMNTICAMNKVKIDVTGMCERSYVNG
jgi:hypothetical protein